MKNKKMLRINALFEHLYNISNPMVRLWYGKKIDSSVMVLTEPNRCQLYSLS